MRDGSKGIPPSSSFGVPAANVCHSIYDRFYQSERGVYAYWALCENSDPMEIYDYSGRWDLNKSSKTWGYGTIRGGASGPVADGETAAAATTGADFIENQDILMNTHQGTVAAWVNAEAASTDETAVWLSAVEHHSGVSIGIAGGDAVCFTGSFTNSGNMPYSVRKCGYVPGSWHRAAFTWNDGKEYLYIDDALAGEASYSGNLDNWVFYYKLFPGCCATAGKMALAKVLVANQAWTVAEAARDFSGAGAVAALPALAPREQLLFDFGWKFTFGHGVDPAKDLGFGAGLGDFAKTGDFGFATVKYDDAKWRALNLSHDWAVELPFVHDDVQQSHGYKPLGRRYPETSVGWYRRVFEVPASDTGRRIAVEFDGAFRSVLVFVNGSFVGRNDSGYSPFCIDLTDFLHYGEKNAIALRVDATFGDGWFYEGAGIYRHVWLTKTDALHLGKWESYARAEVKGNVAELSLGTVVVNEGRVDEPVEVEWQILDADGKQAASVSSASRSAQLQPDESQHVEAVTSIPQPKLWPPEGPYLYSAIVTVKTGDRVRDTERFEFGVRTAEFTADKGFFLNGRPVKIMGTCNHQDHAGVGAALPDRLQWFRLGVLKEMGSNAVRTSHNIPTLEWVRACDRKGMMMMCETRQMSSSSEGLAQLAAMVKRYRNSPSIILWSIGNEEERLQSGEEADIGEKIGASMVRLCHELDPTRPVSAAVNGNNMQGVSETFDMIGFNYNQEFADEYHKAHPDKPVYGSETSSAISTRGEYATDKLRNTINSYDGVVPWGEIPEGWWKFYNTREWLAGGFVWTGFDYRGEPTPYGWPSINSQFGIVDMCGFPKDNYYYYKTWWGAEPALHVFPHWNWHGREGDEIPVWVYSNADEVELIANGQSLGSRKVPHLGHVEWKVRYEPGYIESRATKDGKVILTERRETTGKPASIRLTADRMEINADGEDAAILKVEALDEQGRMVPTADKKIAFKVTGEGALIGVGNSDPNCQESDKAPRRSLFNGSAQVIVQSTKTAGTIEIEATQDGWDGFVLKPAKVTIMTKPVELRPSVG